MELRLKQSMKRDVSPDLAKPGWIEQSKSKMPRKVQVVYYLSRNGQLEHPHFMEVSLSSIEGLYLRDIIHRLNVLRGKGMPYLFSWSCKRSYKNGYVWHDLSEDDLIYPAQGNEFVLKGSELIEGSSDRYQQTTNVKLSTPKDSWEGGPHSVRSQDAVSSTNRALVVHRQRLDNADESAIRRTNSLERIYNVPGSQIPFQSSFKNGTNSRMNTENHHNPSRIDVASTYVRRQGTTHQSYGGDSSWNPLELGEYKVYKAESIASTVEHGADAATQTEERRKRCNKGVSTEEEEEEECNSTLMEAKDNRHEDQNPTVLSGGEVSPPPSSSGSPGSPNSKIKPNSKVNGFRCQAVDEENLIITTRPRASTVLMQLISCGSITVKEGKFVGITHSKYQASCDESRSLRTKVVSCDESRSLRSKVVSRSSLLKKGTFEDELDCMSENPRLAHLRLEDKEYFSGSLVETQTEKEEEGGDPTLKRCASYNEDRSSKSNLLEKPNEEENDGTRTKCIPRKITSFKKQQPTKETQKTPSKELKEAVKLRRLSGGATNSETKDPNNYFTKNSNLSAEFGPQRSDSFREEQKSTRIAHQQRQSSVPNVTVESLATSSQDVEGNEPTIELRQHLKECRSSEMATKVEQKPKSSRGSQTRKLQNAS